MYVFGIFVLNAPQKYSFRICLNMVLVSGNLDFSKWHQIRTTAMVPYSNYNFISLFLHVVIFKNWFVWEPDGSHTQKIMHKIYSEKFISFCIFSSFCRKSYCFETRVLKRYLKLLFLPILYSEMQTTKIWLKE